MAIYPIVFVLSSFLLWTSETQHYSKGIRKSLVFIALLLPIILGGLRKIGIGTDTAVYVNLMYDASLHAKGLAEYFNYEVFQVYHYVPISKWEPGFTVLVYIVTKIFGSYQAVLFAIEAIIVIMIYKALHNFENKIPVWFGMLVFYLLFYNATYNAMRQWVAMSILLFGYYYLTLNKPVKYIISILIAMLFHTSALIGFITLVLYKYSLSGKTPLILNRIRIDKDVYKVLLVTIVGVICLIGLNIIGGLLTKLGTAWARYVVVYLSGEVAIMPMQIIRRLPGLIFMFISWSRLKKETETTAFLVMNAGILDVLVSQLGSITNQSGRMGPYFSIYALLLYPYMVKAHRKNKVLWGLIIVLFLFVSWLYDYVYWGRGETVPYVFFFE